MTGKECWNGTSPAGLAPNGKVLSACSTALEPPLSAKRVCILNHWFVLNIYTSCILNYANNLIGTCVVLLPIIDHLG